MSYINKVQIMGNLGRDPEVRHTQDGKKVVTLNIATSEFWKDKVTQERKDRTEWHKVIIFNEGLAEVAEKYLKKGSKVYTEGQLQTRKWTDKEGRDVYSTEIVLQRFRGELILMDSRTTNEESEPGAHTESGINNQFNTTEPSYGHVRGRAADPVLDSLNDEIPF